MQRINILCLTCVLALAASDGRAEAGGGLGVPQSFVIENGGFEDWQALDPNVARQEGTKSVELLPANQAPAGWIPLREPYPHQGPTVTIAMDEQIKHGGARSVRIENRDPRDIALVHYSTERFLLPTPNRGTNRSRTVSGGTSNRAQDNTKPDDPHNIRPNRRYAVRWWVKGANVDAAGTGPILMLSVFSTKDGKTYRTPAAEESPYPKGTFDWQPRQCVFITDPYARWVGLTFQLRWTTGTIWYDDVEVVDLGPVVHVETY
jgi:hypothetical protein